MTSLAFYCFSSTRLINSIQHKEHSCKILYIQYRTDPVAELNKRRLGERRKMRASWPPGKGIVNLHTIFACSLFVICSSRFLWGKNVLPSYTLSGHKWVPKSAYKNLTKIWSETLVFSSQLRQFIQMIIALDKYTGYMFTSSTNCMMSSSVAMEILCITNIGQGSHEHWKTWKIKKKKFHAWKNHGISKKLKNHGKIMEFCEIICVCLLVFWLLVI